MDKKSSNSVINFHIKIADGILFLKHKYMHPKGYCDVYKQIKNHTSKTDDDEVNNNILIRDFYSDISCTDWFFLRTGDIEHIDKDYQGVPYGYMLPYGKHTPHTGNVEGKCMAICLSKPKKELLKKYLDVAKKLYGVDIREAIDDGVLFCGKTLLMFYR